MPYICFPAVLLSYGVYIQPMASVEEAVWPRGAVAMANSEYQIKVKHLGRGPRVEMWPLILVLGELLGLR